jgi:hypothetical protein
MATPGWDYTTGRGTPDIAALIAALGGAPAATPAPPAQSGPGLPVAPPSLPLGAPASSSSGTTPPNALQSITTLLLGGGGSASAPSSSHGGLLGLGL